MENEIINFIQHEIANDKLSGISACVISGDSIRWEFALGYADIENKKLFETSTVINIASVSKTILGLSIMVAVDHGLIDLDTDVNQYLKKYKIYNPNLSDKGRIITLRNLATHTSGIIDRQEVYSKSYINSFSSERQLSDFLFDYFSIDGKNYSKTNFLPYSPGAQFQYSNIGSALASEILSQGIDISFIEFCKTNIFEPLEMKTTSWLLSDVGPGNHSNLYESNMSQILLYDLITYPDGGLRTSINDLSKFLLMVMNDGLYKDVRIISPSCISEMIKPQFNSIISPDNFNTKKYNQGIFWHIEKNDEIGILIGHTGGDPGVTSYMYFSPYHKSGIILIVNNSISENENKIISKIITMLWQFALN